MKNIMIGMSHTLMNFIPAILGSSDIWLEVIFEYMNIEAAIRRAKSERWSPRSGMFTPKSQIESYALRSSAQRNFC